MLRAIQVGIGRHGRPVSTSRTLEPVGAASARGDHQMQFEGYCFMGLTTNRGMVG
jgi:hypothetical protein